MLVAAGVGVGTGVGVVDGVGVGSGVGVVIGVGEGNGVGEGVGVGDATGVGVGLGLLESRFPLMPPHPIATVSINMKRAKEHFPARFLNISWIPIHFQSENKIDGTCFTDQSRLPR